MALDFPTSPSVNDLYTDSGRTWRWNGTGWAMLPGPPPDIDDWFVIAASDESTDLTAGTNKVYFRMPYAGTLLAVRASVNTVSTGATPAIIVDINEDTGSGPVTLLSTKLSIDASEKTSTTAATAAVISDSALADDAEITIDIDQVGTTPGKGLKVYMKVRRG